MTQGSQSCRNEAGHGPGLQKSVAPHRSRLHAALPLKCCQEPASRTVHSDHAAPLAQSTLSLASQGLLTHADSISSCLLLVLLDTRASRPGLKLGAPVQPRNRGPCLARRGRYIAGAGSASPAAQQAAQEPLAVSCRASAGALPDVVSLTRAPGWLTACRLSSLWPPVLSFAPGGG